MHLSTSTTLSSKNQQASNKNSSEKKKKKKKSLSSYHLDIFLCWYSTSACFPTDQVDLRNVPRFSSLLFLLLFYYMWIHGDHEPIKLTNRARQVAKHHLDGREKVWKSALSILLWLESHQKGLPTVTDTQMWVHLTWHISENEAIDKRQPWVLVRPLSAHLSFVHFQCKVQSNFSQRLELLLCVVLTFDSRFKDSKTWEWDSLARYIREVKFFSVCRAKINIYICRH